MPIDVNGEIRFGTTRRVTFGCGHVYLLINEEGGRPAQALVWIGKAGCCQRTLLEAVCRLVNQLLDLNQPIENVVGALGGLRCDQGIAGAGRLSCVDALAHQLKAFTLKPVLPSEGAHDIPVQKVL